jgi:undecaprenyl diphosphate synthase
MSANTTEGVSLRHVIVVGGTLGEWAAQSDDQWAVRLAELGKVADHVGAGWLTLRPFSSGEGAAAPAGERRVNIGGCQVVAQPDGDGRRRFTRVVAALHAGGTPITEVSIASVLSAPAVSDPDLVVVVGSRPCMPPSLVWELAYSELVFVDASWQHFGPAHLEDAIGAFAHRQRRFGGID